MIVTEAFGTTAPLESETVPVMRPVLACPNKLEAQRTTKRIPEDSVFSSDLIECLRASSDFVEGAVAPRVVNAAVRWTEGFEPARLLSNGDFGGEPLDGRRSKETVD